MDLRTRGGRLLDYAFVLPADSSLDIAEIGFLPTPVGRAVSGRPSEASATAEARLYRAIEAPGPIDPTDPTEDDWPVDAPFEDD